MNHTAFDQRRRHARGSGRDRESGIIRIRNDGRRLERGKRSTNRLVFPFECGNRSRSVNSVIEPAIQFLPTAGRPLGMRGVSFEARVVELNARSGGNLPIARREDQCLV